MTTSTKLGKRVLSGMRSTGKLHLGNYVGALDNWVRMQDEYECFFMVADWHALTTDYADTSRVKQNSIEVALDWLAAGLDPEKSVIFIQSHVPAHAELHLLLSMITPLGWLERVPTYKDQQEQLKDKDLATYGFLGYSLLQRGGIAHRLTQSAGPRWAQDVQVLRQYDFAARGSRSGRRQTQDHADRPGARAA